MEFVTDKILSFFPSFSSFQNCTSRIRLSKIRNKTPFSLNIFWLSLTKKGEGEGTLTTFRSIPYFSYKTATPLAPPFFHRSFPKTLHFALFYQISPRITVLPGNQKHGTFIEDSFVIPLEELT